MIDHLSSISSLVFVIIRVVSLALTFIVFHFGFGHQPSTQWNTPRTRILVLLVVSFVQVSIFTITQFLERIRLEHIDSICRLDSQL